MASSSTCSRQYRSLELGLAAVVRILLLDLQRLQPVPHRAGVLYVLPTNGTLRQSVLPRNQETTQPSRRQAPLNFLVGQYVNVSGMTPSGYNCSTATACLITATTSSTITYTSPNSGLGVGTGFRRGIWVWITNC